MSDQGDVGRIRRTVSREQSAELGALLGVQLRLSRLDRTQTRELEIPSDALDLSDLGLHASQIERRRGIRRVRLEHRSEVQYRDLPVGLPTNDLAGEVGGEALDALRLCRRELEPCPPPKDLPEERQRLVAPLSRQRWHLWW